MATSGPTSLPAFFSNDTDFRNWAIGVHNALVAVGLTQTADTGQINTVTVIKPVAANTAGGYEVFRFSDALQATLPIFIKVEYGVSGVNRPSLWITVGTTTNGAGTLGGQATARLQAQATADKAAGATLPLYASGASDRVHLACNLDFANVAFGILWGVERTKDSTGANTADGYLLFIASSGNNAGAGRAITATGPTGAGVGAGPCVPTATVGPSVFGSDVAVSPAVYFLGKPFYALVLGLLIGDIGGATTFTATVLGATHTYLSLSGAGFPGLTYSGAGSGASAAILWE